MLLGFSYPEYKHTFNYDSMTAVMVPIVCPFLYN
jgi:hypothetical protein